MNPSTLRLSLLAALLGASLAAHAATLAYTLRPNQAATIPAFDPSLGTLTSIQVGGDVTGRAVYPTPMVQFAVGSDVQFSAHTGSGSSGVYWSHICWSARNYSVGGLIPPFNVYGASVFHDAGYASLPLDWGLSPMPVNWEVGGMNAGYQIVGQYQVRLNYTPVPEPAPLAALGLGALALLRRRRK